MYYLGIIKLTGSFMDLIPLKIVYSSLVCSHLEYCIIMEENQKLNFQFWTAFWNKFICTGFFGLFCYKQSYDKNSNKIN